MTTVDLPVKSLDQQRQRRVYGDILHAVGQTPLVRLNRVVAEINAGVFAKVESLNPGGSVKDRLIWVETPTILRDMTSRVSRCGSTIDDLQQALAVTSTT
jgi:threonine dehydratase